MSPTLRRFIGKSAGGHRIRHVRLRVHAAQAAHDGIASRGCGSRSDPSAHRMERGHGNYRQLATARRAST